MGVKQANPVRKRSRAPHILQVSARLRDESHFSALEEQAGAAAATKPSPTDAARIGASSGCAGGRCGDCFLNGRRVIAGFGEDVIPGARKADT